MSYSTPALVRRALVPSSDGAIPGTPSNTAADLTDAELQDAIDEADSLIDGYLTLFYATPLTLTAGNVAPHPVDYWSRNIAAYNATLGYRGSQDFTERDPIALRYANTMAALTAVSKGTLNLALPQNEGSGSSVAAAPPINPYIGDLWTPDDFSIRPAISPQLNTPGGWTPYWHDPDGLL